MDRLKLKDLAPSMRLDESLHLTSGELVLYRGQAVDDLLLDALAASGATEIALAANPAEVEALALDADREAVPIAEISERTVFGWGLYDVAGRKVLSARRRLTTHRAWLLKSSGVDVLLEPAGGLAAAVARRRRLLVRRRAPPGKEGGASRSAPGLPAPGAVARTMLGHAVLASEAEAVIKELAVGISLDVPRTLEAARSAVRDTFSAPAVSAACVLQLLASGDPRRRGAACAVIAAAAARAAAWRQDDCLELAASALLHEAPLAGSGREPGATERAPVRAHMLLADADGLATEVPLTVLQARERLDGSGGPFGLTGEEILPAAKLIAAADVFCAALAPGGEQEQLSPHEAVKRCIGLAGEGLLDGEAVRALLRAVGYYPVGTGVWLSTGELARVVAATEAYERPVVSVARTSAGLPSAEKRVMDLSRLTGIQVERPASRDELPWDGPSPRRSGYGRAGGEGGF